MPRIDLCTFLFFAGLVYLVYYWFFKPPKPPAVA